MNRITVENLSFSYTKSPFISDMSFSVLEGEIFGFLGPSGAGKSTLQKILTGMLRTYEGICLVNGIECRKRTKHFYEDIGVDFEFSTLYEKLTAKENLQFFSSLYEKKPRPIGELLEMAGLERDADKRVADYSKGMKSRLNFIKALLHDPRLLFLDEPTSGLDPVNSRKMKDIMLEEKAKGKTGYLFARFGIPAGIAFLATMVLLPVFKLTALILPFLFLLAAGGTLQGMIAALLVLTLSSNRLEGMAVAKLSTLTIFGAAVPFFVRSDVQYAASVLPSFWMGKAVSEGRPLSMLPAFSLSAVWIGFLLKRYLRRFC